MNELCFSTNLSSTELAAWIQAIGSVVAILAAAGIAIYQARVQHRNSLALHMKEKQTERADITKTLSVLATNASKAMTYVSNKLNDRSAVHRAGEGEITCGIGELYRIDNYLNSIPLHNVPHSMVTLTMILGSTVRQFKEKVETTLNLHRKMDGDMFEDFFKTIAEMNTSIDATCRDIDAEVKQLET